MKINIKSVVAILFVISLFGCLRKSEQSNDGWNDLTKEQQDFWNQFDSDTIFQKEHVRFPLTIEMTEIPEDTVETSVYEKIDKNNYQSYYDYSEPTVLSYEYKDDENFSIIKRGADNGIHVTYIFEKDNDKWCLVYVLDESN